MKKSLKRGAAGLMCFAMAATNLLSSSTVLPVLGFRANAVENKLNLNNIKKSPTPDDATRVDIGNHAITNIIEKSSVKVSFYKFNWQRAKLQSQSIVSDNFMQQNLSEQELENADKNAANTALEFTLSFISYMSFAVSA